MNEIVSTVFGTLGAVLWSIQLIPQIIHNYRRHSTESLSPGFMLTWAVAGIPLGVYNITSNLNIALRVQAQILTALSLTTFGQCLYYRWKWRRAKIVLVVMVLGCVMGGIEAGLVFALRSGIRDGITWPKTLMAVLAACLLCLGVAEQYVSIYRSRSTDGISVIFCGLDAAGDVASIISVVFGAQRDILGIVIYAVEFVFWMGIFACIFYFRWRKPKIVD